MNKIYNIYHVNHCIKIKTTSFDIWQLRVKANSCNPWHAVNAKPKDQPAKAQGIEMPLANWGGIRPTYL